MSTADDDVRDRALSRRRRARRIAQFTPGPWAPSAAPGGWDTVREPGGLLVCSLNLNNHANMYLIAAAPELYAALAALHAEADVGMINGATLNLAVTALAKARGEGQ